MSTTTTETMLTPTTTTTTNTTVSLNYNLPPPTTPLTSHLQLLTLLLSTLTHANTSYTAELASLTHAAHTLGRARRDALGPSVKGYQPLWIWDLPQEAWWMPRLGPKKAALDELAKAVRMQVWEIIGEVEEVRWGCGAAGEGVAEECEGEIEKVVREIMG